ncbi:HET-domain-containing protein [Cenococcum geophilum]
MGVFKYEPIDLERPAFRLLRLFKGAVGDDIECELFQAWLQGDSTIPYKALSYIWGSTETTERIKINRRTLGVTNNLYLALRYLLYINQGNNKKQEHQANQVIFWLGLATYKIKMLMDSLKSVLAHIFALAPLLMGVQPEPHCQASRKRDLYTLLLNNPRDIIYALLGIYSNARTNNLHTDYTKTV